MHVKLINKCAVSTQHVHSSFIIHASCFMLHAICHEHVQEQAEAHAGGAVWHYRSVRFHSLYSLYFLLLPCTRAAGYFCAFFSSLASVAAPRSMPHRSASRTR